MTVKSRLLLPFWYWPTRVVLEKGPLNGCVCVCDLDANLRQAIMQFSASDLYCSVEHIKIIVKQLTGCSRDNFSNKAAGALTCSTVVVVKTICDEAAGDDSHLSVRNTKQEGWTYMQTLTSGQKLHVIRSTGKHNNAIISFLEWATHNIPPFVKNRPLHMKKDKLKFFKTLNRV